MDQSAIVFKGRLNLFKGREDYRINCVEVREKPPMVMMTPTEVPEEIGYMVVEISKGFKRHTRWKR